MWRESPEEAGEEGDAEVDGRGSLVSESAPALS